MAHLEAALAVWRYSLDSARWIFGDSLGDPTADEIWALAKDGPHGERSDPSGSSVTRSEVRDLFSRKKKPARSTAPSPSSKKPDASHGQANPTAAAGPPSAGSHAPPEATPHGQPTPPLPLDLAEHRAGRRGLSPSEARARERSDLDSRAAGATIIQVQGEGAASCKGGDRSFRSYPLTASPFPASHTPSLTCQRRQSPAVVGRLHAPVNLTGLVPTSAQPRLGAQLRVSAAARRTKRHLRRASARSRRSSDAHEVWARD